MSGRVFLLSPANCGGARARQLLSPLATSPLAAKLRSPRGAALGELFAFVSTLYFRGKLTYAARFAQPPTTEPGVGAGIYVITANAGLRPPDHLVNVVDFVAFSGVGIRADNPGFTEPLRLSARRLREAIGAQTEVVLLGSVASPKYVDVLLEIFQEQLRFPIAFVGRGDMSRGGLLLRCAAAGNELTYVPVAGAVRRGDRPPKLVPLRRAGGRGPGNARGGKCGARE